jgi:hypothetical protein
VYSPSLSLSDGLARAGKKSREDLLALTMVRTLYIYIYIYSLYIAHILIFYVCMYWKRIMYATFKFQRRSARSRNGKDDFEIDNREREAGWEEGGICSHARWRGESRANEMERGRGVGVAVD